MKKISFNSLVEVLHNLGFDEADPELKLFYLIIQDKVEDVKKLLQKEGWKDGTYNVSITDTEIANRYQSLINAPWVQKEINKFHSSHK